MRAILPARPPAHQPGRLARAYERRQAHVGLLGQELVPSIAGGPPVSILRVRSTIGPNRLTYYRHAHGRLVAYRPRGIEVPERCPRDGFPFAADFGFLDGSHASAHTTVRCPPRHR
jgi:hypothetical protein